MQHMQQTFPLTLANPIQAGSAIHDRAAQDHEAWAVFGEVDFDLSDIWTLSLGLRYTDESKDMVSTFSESIAIPGRHRTECCCNYRSARYYWESGPRFCGSAV